MNLQSAKPGVLAIATVAERNPAMHVNDYSDYVKISLNIKLKAILRGFIKVLNRRATEFDTRAKNWQGPEGLDF